MAVDVAPVVPDADSSEAQIDLRIGEGRTRTTHRIELRWVNARTISYQCKVLVVLYEAEQLLSLENCGVAGC